MHHAFSLPGEPEDRLRASQGIAVGRRKRLPHLLHPVLLPHHLVGAAMSLLVRTGWARRFHTPSGREVGRVERQ